MTPALRLALAAFLLTGCVESAPQYSLAGGETGVFTLRRETQPYTIKIGLPEKPKELFDKYMGWLSSPPSDNEAF
jgi:hypothetical protein